MAKRRFHRAVAAVEKTVGGFIEIFAGHKDQPKREAGYVLGIDQQQKIDPP